MRSAGGRAAEILLAATFLFSAVLKVATFDESTESTVLLSSWGSIVAVSILEVLLVACFFTRLGVWALRGCIMIAVGGVWAVLVLRWVHPDTETACGCLGRVPLSDGEHGLLAVTVLVLASIGLRHRLRDHRHEVGMGVT